MNETREVLGVWDWDKRSSRHSRNNLHEKRRSAYINDHFYELRASVPAFIWKVEFFKLTNPDAVADYVSYGFTLHRYAANTQGKRYLVWVRAYDEHGRQVNTKMAATCAPENYRIQNANSLPPDWLLKNNPEPRHDD